MMEVSVWHWTSKNKLLHKMLIFNCGSINEPWIKMQDRPKIFHSRVQTDPLARMVGLWTWLMMMCDVCQGSDPHYKPWLILLGALQQRVCNYTSVTKQRIVLILIRRHIQAQCKTCWQPRKLFYSTCISL